MRHFILAAVFLFAGLTMARAETLHLFAAGSLKRALGDAVAAYEKASGDKVETTFGASGLMREKIEAGAGQIIFSNSYVCAVE